MYVPTLFAGCGFRNRLLRKQERRGFFLQPKLVESVLVMLRGLAKSLLQDHKTSSLLLKVHQSMELRPSVHGPVDAEDMNHYNTLVITKGVRSYRCKTCGHSARWQAEARNHSLICHFMWRLPCSREGCRALVPALVTGKPGPHTVDHE